MPYDDVLRWISFGVFMSSVPIYAFMVGVTIHGRSWPWRIVLGGGFVLLLYMTVGQIKARVYDLPYDLISFSGLVGVLVLIVGMTAVLVKERQTHGRG